MITQVDVTGGQDDNAQKMSLAQLPAGSRAEPAGLPANGQQPAGESNEQTVVIRVEYELQPFHAGVSFHGLYAHTSNQVPALWALYALMLKAVCQSGIGEQPALLRLTDMVMCDTYR